MNRIDQWVGSRIRERRLELAYSSDRLARDVEVSEVQLERYERGEERVGARKLLAIAHRLEVPTSYFFANSSTLFPGGSAVEDDPTLRSDKRAVFDDGLRMLRAFSEISNPTLRDLVVRLTMVVAKIDKAQAERS